MGNMRKRLVGSEVKWEKERIRFAASSKHKITKIESYTIFSTKSLAIVFNHLVQIFVDLFRDLVFDTGPRRKSLKKIEESKCSLFRCWKNFLKPVLLFVMQNFFGYYVSSV